MNRHPHADIAIEWFQNTSRVVEYRHHNADKWSTWVDGPCCPDFDTNYEWRFKPEPKPDVVAYLEVGLHGYAGGFSNFACPDDNLKLTFDGETGKLIKAEVIE